MYGTETGPGAAAQKSFDVLTILDSGKTPRLSNLLFLQILPTAAFPFLLQD